MAWTHNGDRTKEMAPSAVPLHIRSPTQGDDWLHEPKWDGFRFQVIKDGVSVCLYSPPPRPRASTSRASWRQFPFVAERD